MFDYVDNQKDIQKVNSYTWEPLVYVCIHIGTDVDALCTREVETVISYTCE